MEQPSLRDHQVQRIYNSFTLVVVFSSVNFRIYRNKLIACHLLFKSTLVFSLFLKPSCDFLEMSEMQWTTVLTESQCYFKLASIMLAFLAE